MDTCLKSMVTQWWPLIEKHSNKDCNWLIIDEEAVEGGKPRHKQKQGERLRGYWMILKVAYESYSGETWRRVQILRISSQALFSSFSKFHFLS